MTTPTTIVGTPIDLLATIQPTTLGDAPVHLDELTAETLYETIDRVLGYQTEFTPESIEALYALANDINQPIDGWACDVSPLSARVGVELLNALAARLGAAIDAANPPAPSVIDPRD